MTNINISVLNNSVEADIRSFEILISFVFYVYNYTILFTLKATAKIISKDLCMYTYYYHKNNI